MVTVADSIGIRLLKSNCLLAGVGNQLNVYAVNANNGSVRQQIQLPFRSKVYGIHSVDQNICQETDYCIVHGGRELAIVAIEAENDIRLVKSLALSDWISSVHPYKSSNNEVISFCTLTAHNVAMEFQINVHSGTWSIVNKSYCVDKTNTLYCSLLFGGSWHNTTVFGGNAFGELIIWNVSRSKFSKKELRIDQLMEGEHVAKLVIMNDAGVLVVMTNKQNLFYANVDENDSDWKAMASADEQLKVVLLASFQRFIVFAGFGFVNIFEYKNGSFNVFAKMQLAIGLVRSLKFLSENELIISNNTGKCLYVKLNVQNDDGIEFELPVCKERWITVAAKSECFIIVGDRCGNIHLYELQKKMMQINLKCTLKHVHGNLGCTSIDFDPQNALQFVTAGHDGKQRRIAINKQTGELEQQFTYDVPVRWCDKTIPLDANRRCMLLAGFNDSHFIAWASDNSFRFEFDCGGGHRYWDLRLNTENMRAHLIFIRNRSLCSVQFQLTENEKHPFHIPKSNWHSRPCNVMNVLGTSDGRYLIVSGGDDNLLKINEIDNTNEIALKHRADMIQHISNIRTIFTIAIDNQMSLQKWLIFSAGGRAQICVTEIEMKTNQPLQCREVCNFMLRSSDLERTRCGKSQCLYFDPETRFMSLVAYADQNVDELSVFVGCSDGFLRKFRYKNQSISLMESTFYGRCILHVHQFEFNGRKYLISMATDDGLIVFWNIDNFAENSKPCFVLRHHESGINSFDVFINDSIKTMYVATGGDDQAVVLSMLRLETNDCFEVEKITRFASSHSAQVNGVRLCAKRQALFTIGVDQTMMRIDLNELSCEQIAYSCMSDAKGLQLLNDIDCAVVFGCGIQIIHIENVKRLE